MLALARLVPVLCALAAASIMLWASQAPAQQTPEVVVDTVYDDAAPVKTVIDGHEALVFEKGATVTVHLPSNVEVIDFTQEHDVEVVTPSPRN